MPVERLRDDFHHDDVVRFGVAIGRRPPSLRGGSQIRRQAIESLRQLSPRLSERRHAVSACDDGRRQQELNQNHGALDRSGA